MSTKLHEKPYFPRHLRDRLKRYDRRLDLVWNALKGRWEIWQDVRGGLRVTMRTVIGCETQMDVQFPKIGLSLDRPIQFISIEKTKNPHRVMVLGRDLDENEIFGRLWLSDVWRFKNNGDVMERDIADTNQKFMLREEEKNESDLRDLSKDVMSYATNRPLSGGGSKHTSGVRKLSEDRN